MEAVERVAERLHLDGVYGPLYKLFDTNDSFKTAVENIANNRSVLGCERWWKIIADAFLCYSLFHVVVDNDETASRILEVMVREQLGRVTFMPLNRLRPPEVRYPEQAEEAVPM